jgi:hypothetical protein
MDEEGSVRDPRQPTLEIVPEHDKAAEQWREQAEARDRLERADVPRGDRAREPDEWDPYRDVSFPWVPLVLGGIAIVIALVGLYWATAGQI